MSKVSLPNSTTLTFYYSFSTSTFVLTFLFAPIVFYIILTQSKALKNFKWFLINQLFWNLLLEAIIGIFKMILLFPHVSMYSEIVESPFITAVIFFCTVILALISIVAVVITSLNRYFSIFPSTMNRVFNPRNFIIFGVLLLLATILPFIITYANFMLNDLTLSYQNAIEKDSFFSELNEPSMMFFPEEYWKPYKTLTLKIFKENEKRR